MKISLPISKSTFLILLLIFNAFTTFGFDYEAPKAAVAPVIDGVGSEACWSGNWYTLGQTWIGTPPTAADFSGRFKFSWDANKLYLLAEITNDVLNDNYPDPLNHYYDDDALEILIDENKSGGDHQTNYNAFAYHVSTLLDVVDVDVDGSAKLYNQNITAKWTKTGNVYTWECAINVYTDKFKYGAASNPLAVLETGKVMGFSLAYCDNDGGDTRQNFMGSEIVNLADKNVAYKTADYFGSLTLVDKINPATISFSQNLVASGLANPTVMVCTPDGRIFICEQEGNLRVIKNGALLPAPVLSVKTTQVGYYSERGLIGFAMDPLFMSNNYIYVYYTSTDGVIHNRVSRFTMNGDVADPASETILLELEPLGASVSHNGGALGFGKDGKLYIATGDNQLTDVPRVSQDLTRTFGKLLRINPDGTIPVDNPYDTGKGATKMVWSYGLRNPFTFDVQPGTGRIFINDVGEVTDEEINEATVPNKNFGWPSAEGMSSDPQFTNPLYYYKNNQTPSDSEGCAITGGVFFNPTNTNYPSQYIGCYFFGDFCNNWINYLDLRHGNKRNLFIKNLYGGPIAIDMGTDGNLYYLSRTTSSVYKIQASDNPFPIVTRQPDSTYTFASQPATLSATVTGIGPFTYQWTKNGVAITGATSASLTIPSASADDAGKYAVVITNATGSVTSDEVPLVIGPFNSKPVATIIQPVTGDTYFGGMALKFSGSATDPEDGQIPLENYSWVINFHHDIHVHDGIPVSGISSGTFNVPTAGETSDNVWFRVILIVKDKSGLVDSAIVDVRPRKSALTFNTLPPGLSIKLDGQPKGSPINTLSVQGVIRSIGPVSPQTINGKTYVFDHWLNGGPADQSFGTPAENTAFTAVFVPGKRDSVFLNVIQDAYVQDGLQSASDATTAYGSINPGQLITKSYQYGPNRYVYLKFDISGFTDTIKNAFVKLRGSLENTTGLPPFIPVSVYSAADTSWKENALTWNTKPAPALSALDTFNVSGVSSQFYFGEVTSALRAAIASGKKLITFVLINPQGFLPRVIFDSKENASGLGPQLVIKTDSTAGITLKNFTVVAMDQSDLLSWVASNEASNKSFSILRAEGPTGPFVSLGTIPSLSKSGESSYKYTDQQPVSGLNYYVLEVTDKSGYQTFSNIVSVISNSTAVSFPVNQTSELISILEANKEKALHMNLVNMTGQEVFQTNAIDQVNPLQFPPLSPGMYLLRITTEEKIVYSKRILLLK